MIKDDEPERSFELHKKACDLGLARGCFNAAERMRANGKAEPAAPLYQKACTGAGDDKLLKSFACQIGSQVAFDAGDFGAAAAMAGELCTGDATVGCNLLGAMHALGRGVLQDKKKAGELFTKGCAGGDKDACANAKKVEGSLDVEGANLSVGSITADGFTLTDMSCKTDRGRSQGRGREGPRSAS